MFLSKQERFRVARRVSLSQRREFLSHVGLICDDPRIQAELPQHLICNAHTLSAADFRALREPLAAMNVYLEREQSS